MASRLVVEILSDAKNFGRGLDTAKKDLDGFARKVDQADASFGSINSRSKAVTSSLKVMAATAAVGATAFVGFAKSAINSFTQLGEATNAVNVTFGEASTKLLEFSRQAAESVGLSAAAFLQMATPLGAILQNFGLSAEDAADKTLELTQRAADMASVFNVDVSDALGAVQAALRGEGDPIERFGVSVAAAAVEAKVLALGLAETKSEITETDKVMGRLALIMEQTDKVAGDFANTSDSLANRQRTLAARFEDTKAALGERLAPVAEKLLDIAEDLIPEIEELAGAFATLAEPLPEVVGGLIDAKNAIDDFGDSIQIEELATKLVGAALLLRTAVRLLPTTIGAIPAWFLGAGLGVAAAGAVGGEFLTQGFNQATIKNQERYAERAGYSSLRLLELTQQIAAYQGISEEAARAQAEIELGFILQAEAANEAIDAIDSATVQWETFLQVQGSQWTGATEEIEEGADRQSEALARLQARYDLTNTEEAQDAINKLAEAFVGTISVFDEAPEAIKISIKKAIDNITTQTDAYQRFARGIEVLSAAGFSMLVADLTAKGVAAVDLVEAFAGDISAAWEAELNLREATEAALDAAEAALGRKLPTLATTFTMFGSTLARAIEFGFSELDLTGTIEDAIDRTSGWSATITSRTGGKQTARAMGGPVSAGQTYIVGERGPELFVPPSSGYVMSNAQSFGSNVTINVTNPTTRDLDVDLARSALLAGLMTQVGG